MEKESMKECPFCREVIKVDAVKCRYCKSRLESVTSEPVSRALEGRMIAGVASYVSRTLGISVSMTRVIFIIATIVMPPLGIGVYGALWLMIPPRPHDQSMLERLVAGAKRLYDRLRKMPPGETQVGEHRSNS